MVGVVAHLSMPVAETVWVVSSESGLWLMMEESGEVSGSFSGESVTTAGGLRISISSRSLGVSLSG